MRHPIHLAFTCPPDQRCPDMDFLARRLVADWHLIRHVQALHEARIAWLAARHRGAFGPMVAAEIRWTQAAGGLEATGLPAKEVAAISAAVRRRTDTDVAKVLDDV